MKYIFLLIVTFTFSCKKDIDKKSFITNESFYLKWDESSLNEIGNCCPDSCLNNFIQTKVKSLFHYRQKLFTSLIVDRNLRDSCVIVEHVSPGNQFAVHMMTIYLGEKGTVGRVNYKGEVTIDTVYYGQKGTFEYNSNCCPFTQEEFKTYEGYIPLKCVTVVNFDHKKPFFKVTLSTK